MPESMLQDGERLGTEQTKETTAEIQQYPFSWTKFLKNMFFVSKDRKNQWPFAKTGVGAAVCQNWQLGRYLTLYELGNNKFYPKTCNFTTTFVSNID